MDEWDELMQHPPALSVLPGSLQLPADLPSLPVQPRGAGKRTHKDEWAEIIKHPCTERV